MSNANFKANFDKIDWSIGAEEIEKRRLAREAKDPDNEVNAPSVMKPITPFVSPIDGTVISDRGQRRAHEKKHGVTNAADYSEKYYKTKQHQLREATQGKTQKDKTHRREMLRKSLHDAGIHD